MKSRSRRIAVVEDDASVRRALTRALKSMNHDPVTFASGEELLDGDDVAGFDCILLDHRLGGITGLELAERLFAAGHRIPRILLTAEADSPNVARRQDGVELLAKPVDAVVLGDAIERAVTDGRRSNGRRLARALS